MSPSKLTSCAIVFITPDLGNATRYYRDVLGFRAVEHTARAEKFTALYRDAVEIVLVQSRYGTIQPNRSAYGAGYDAYLVPESLAAVDSFHRELESKGVKIIQPPAMTTYGSREFVFADCDGRQIGVGLIRDKDVFFESSK